ncbi:hypothetical protein K491DRAFT_763187 [Lophiostoma macrostomum CBS 122681]|uniref:Uncharacterized protein n=1 Tax=Lophiostoma macrostomum CBS 122681 TaxID=1314788 RepID=A0A6A6SMN5_9PLEO|nr:hypothetical protein K491DRAFT_763187 [Lophiostoma macrostomum CBS 122681]
MQFTIALTTLALLSSASAIGVNFFSAEDCKTFTHTVSNPGKGKCAAVSPSGLSWEIVNSSGCTVHVFQDAGCGSELAPGQSGADKCFDSPVQIRGVKFDC